MNDRQATNITTQGKVPFRFELMRKGVHMMSLSIPIVYYFISKDMAIAILVPMTLAFIIPDLLRSFHQPSFRLYNLVFGKMLRTHEKTLEKKTLNGASWVLVAATLCVLIFPKLIAITAFTVLIVSDTTAALVGRRFGTKKYRDKTLEGSLAFVFSAWIVVLFTPKVASLPAEYIIAFVAAIAGAVAEVFSFNIIDDNFSIPITVGAVMWILYTVFLPQLNVFILDM